MQNGKQCKTADEALQMLIDKHMKPGVPRQYKYQGGMVFREKYVWQLGIEDLMRSNDASI
jgi:hypothetical protein